VTQSPPAGDRRAALKARHRRAILDAAAALLDEHGIGGFSVDDLAERADVSRRTVFNHFATLADITTTVCTEFFDEAMEHAGGPPPDAAPSVFDDVSDALRAMDFISPMAYLVRVLRTDQGATDQLSPSFTSAVSGLGDRFSSEIRQRHPAADPFAVDLLVGSTLAGLLVVAHRWAEATGGADDDESRRTFSTMLEGMLTAVGSGFASESVFPRTA
jgi:AcrR family transcriptional regulator